jgi:hypothetical protein
VFDRFWETYPRRLARKDAEKAWGKIPAHKKLDVMEALRKHITMWKQQGTEKRFIPYPATWLNGARWEDEIEIAPEMPQCDWNRNGMRDVGAPRCDQQAIKEHDGQYYCAPHCARLGLKFLRAA